MHYANGREAQIGDLVRGKGYNYKHEIIGILIKAKPQESACNCEIHCFAAHPDGYGIVMKRTLILDRRAKEFGQSPFVEGELRAEPTIEYGQLDAFVALDPKTGEILPPESEFKPSPISA